ncbi:MAG: NADH-quinone oxidoreductase subunit J [Desulfobacterales bacterium]|nr:NADH-quinone oxidoreductase subunit J [Desulfobacterales bacterium]
MIIYRYIAEGLFIGFIMLVMSGSILAVRSRILMHAVLGLAVSFLGVAGLYFFLGSMFLTLMQILIYVGAICVVLVFGIMVGKTPKEIDEKQLRGKHSILAVSLSTVIFFMLSASVFFAKWNPVTEKIGDFSMAYLGKNMLYHYCLAFELISVILLAAIIGAIILARGGREADLG